MTERDRLLHAVAAEPDVDTPRRIVADWLDDHDEPQRATFIRTRLDLALMARADPRYPATLAAHRRAWRPTTRLWEDHIPGARVAFHRGFLHRANFGELSDYLDTDPRDWNRVPLEELGLFSRGHLGRAMGHSAHRLEPPAAAVATQRLVVR